MFSDYIILHADLLHTDTRPDTNTKNIQLRAYTLQVHPIMGGAKSSFRYQ